MSAGWPNRLHLRRGIVAAGVALIVGFAISAAVDVWRSHQQALVDNDRELANLSKALADQSANAFKSGEFALHTLTAWYQGVGRRADAEQWREAFELIKTGLPLNGLFVSDARRALVHASGPLPAGMLNGSTGTLGTIDGHPSVLLSRELRAADGTLEAHVAALVDLREFRRLYEGIQLAPGHRLLLVRDDGLILARYPDLRGFVGSSYPDFAQAMQLKAERGAAATLGPTVQDGAPRYFRLAPVAGTAFLVMATRDKAVALGGWREQAVHAGTRTALLLLLSTFLLAALVRQLARLDARERTLWEQAALLDQTRDMVFVRGADDAITYWNRGAEEAYGWSRSEAIGRRSHELLRTEFPAAIEEIEAKLEATGHWEGELVHRRRDGSALPVASRWALQRGDRGRPIGVLETNNDITDRRLAEQAQRDLAEQWRAAFASNPTMYFIVDANGAVLSASDFGAEELGYDAGELVGRAATDSFAEEDREHFRRNADACFANLGQRRRWEARKVRKDGTMLWVRETANAVLLKNQAVLLVVCEDITARKLAEEALRQSETYLAEAQRLTHTGSWAFRPATLQSTYWSDEMFRINGMDPQAGQALGMDEVLTRFIHPDDVARFWSTFQSARQAKADFEMEHRIVLEGGTIKHLHVIGRSVLDGAGELAEYVGTVVDVTERKRIEAERAAHVWCLESMDRINRAVQAGTDPEQMMSVVLDAVLEIFGSDRAWLIHPCDPAAPSWRVVMEQARPEFPGAYAENEAIPTSPRMEAAFRRALAASAAVQYGSDHECPVPPSVADRFGVRSMIAMAIYPKADNPYLFGLHQCSAPRVWTAQEERLFVEIGRRLADSLSGLLMFRSLLDSEHKLEEAQRIAQVGYWESEFGRENATLSQEACRIVGLQPEDLGRWQGRLLEIVHPDDRPRVLQALGPPADVTAAELEFRLVRPDGEVRTVLARREVKQPQPGHPLRQFGMVQDITELRRAEDERRASEIRFRTVVDSAADAFFLQEESGTLIDVNRQACISLGYTREELIGMHPASFDPEARLGPRGSIRERLRGEEVFSIERRHRRKDGTLFPVEIRLRAFTQDGRRYFVALARDISERKEAEAAHARLEAELRRAQKMEAIGTLAGGIAHDFNNILGAILGYGEIAQWKVSDDRPIDDELDQVMQAGQRGKRLVEHILAFSRSGAGDPGPVHVQSVVEETLALIAASLPPGVRLEQRLDAGNAAITGDATQLHQVAMNLCTNAIQAMPHGGALSISLDRMEVAQQRALSHGVLAPGAYVRLEVGDTGTGIPRAALERIFDPFFTTKGVGKGTGLGLSLVHGIVTDYHGAIDVSTVEGVGSTFRVLLPSAGELSMPADEAIEALAFGAGESVMIVDDEKPLVRLAEETLAQLGYDPAGFDSSVAALAAFLAEPDRYDMVLTDATMPELTGTDLAREIHQLRPDVPIVLMSGYQGPQLTEMAHAVGICEILHKPLVSRDLGRSLARARTLLTRGERPVA
jgi:PAS domain S-box-containing protein